MRLQKMGNLIAIESKPGQVTGFHSQKLEVASLSAQAWAAIAAESESSPSPEARPSHSILNDLQSWDQESLNGFLKPKIQNFQSITINVTQVCNLHCTYCAAGGDGTFGDPVKKISVEKTIPQLLFLLKRVPDGGHFQVTFLGGEPLLYPEGIQILAETVQNESQKRNIKNEFIVVTNGTLINEKTLAVLKNLKAHLTISIDGPASVNDVLRPSKGGQAVTQKVIEGIQKLVAAKSQLGKIGLSGVFGKTNLNIQKAFEFYRSFDVDWFDFTYDHLETLPEISQAFTEKVLMVADQAFAHGGESALRKIKFFDSLFSRLDQQEKLENYCGAGKSYFVMDARNNLYTCPWLVGESKEIVGTGQALWEAKLDPYKAPLVEKNGCQNCWARFLCGGGCMYIHRNKTGSKHQVDENFCERTRTLMAMGIVYYEQCRRGLESEFQVAKGESYESSQNNIGQGNTEPTGIADHHAGEQADV